MALPTSGAIALTDIQTEFGGVNPINMSEYYRGGLYVTINNVGIPASGIINMGSFYSGLATSSINQVTTALKTSPYSSVRNLLFSKYAADNGLETNLNTAFTDGGGSNRSSSTVTATYTFATTGYTAAFDPLFKTTYITFIMRNSANGTLTNAITVNGVSRTLTNLAVDAGAGYSTLFSYCNVPVGFNALKGLTLTATFTKGTSNNENCQELYIIPGRWIEKSHAHSTGTTSASLGTAAVDDIVFFKRSGQYDGHFLNASSSGGEVGGTGTEILRRATRWYDNGTTVVKVINTAGTVTILADEYVQTNYTTSSGTTTITGYTTYTWQAHGVLMTCTQV
jgi:hypothetical protein